MNWLRANRLIVKHVEGRATLAEYKELTDLLLEDRRRPGGYLAPGVYEIPGTIVVHE